MQDTAELRKARGAFFTPPSLARFLARWAIRHRDDRILEPSCGEASFLVAAAEQLRTLNGRVDNGQLHGVELHGPSASNAEQVLADIDARAHIQVRDFFDVQPSGQYAAVLGNPPYVRYQNFSGRDRAKGRRAALEAGVDLTGLASSWAAFVVHASRFLADDGRMGLVLPAELLTVNYASDVRRFLLERFARVRLLMFHDRVFPDVLEEVVLLLAEGTGPADGIELHQAQDASQLVDAENIRWVAAPIEGAGKWLPGILPADALELYDGLVDGDHFTTLAHGWGKPGIGAVTGNNDFFALTGRQVDELGLSSQEVERLSPPGSSHLRGLSFTKSRWDELVEQGRRTYLFHPGDEPSTNAQRYIDQGEREGVPDAYKCRARSPWWQVPLQPVPDLFLTYMNHVTPQLSANRARVRHLNSVHGVMLKNGRKRLGRDLLPIATLNSVTLLGAELVGRSYGGGMLKLEPSEADRLPVPSPDLVEAVADDLRALRSKIARRLRSGGVLDAAKLVDRVLLARQVDLEQAELEQLRAAKEALFSRRDART